MTAENAKMFATVEERTRRAKARIMERIDWAEGRRGKKPKVNCSIKGKRKAHFHFMLATGREAGGA